MAGSSATMQNQQQWLSQWRLAARIAGREARTGFGGFRVFIICLALGVGAIAAVGLLAEAFRAGLVQEGRSILGGDVELTLTQRRATETEQRFLSAQGRLSEVATLRAMAHLPDGKDSALVQIKSVDQNYPLFGKVALSPQAQPLAALQKGANIVVDEVLLARLDLERGASVRIGAEVFKIAAVIKREPDRVSTGLAFGPRVLMSQESLAATQLIKPGSLVRWRYRLKLAEGELSVDGLEGFRNAVAQAYPNNGWRIRDRSDSAPRIKRFVDRLAMLLTFVALTSLVVGGVGIGTAAKNYLDGRVNTIAMLKCLGASGGLIFKIYLIHLLRLVLIGTVIGLVVGIAVTSGAGPLLENLLPLPAKFGIYWPPLVVAGLFGLAVTLLFALWSLGSAQVVPAAALFRARVAGLPNWPPLRYMVATIGLLAALIALIVSLVPSNKFAAIYAGGIIGSFVLFWAIAKVIVWGARRTNGGRLRILRLALLQIRSAGLAVIATVIALGLGLSLLVALTVIETNFVRHLVRELPKAAPSFFFVDIQSNQLQAFEAMVNGAAKIDKFNRVPMLRGRIVRLNDVPAEKIKAPQSVQWVLNGDRGITYALAKPPEIEVTEGKWWPEDYAGPPLVSFAEGIANGLGLKIGDQVTVNILGREITAKIANLRRVEWGSLGINFVMLFSPDPVSGAPHSHLATVAMNGEAERDFMRQISAKFPNITVIRVKEVLQSINELMEKLLIAARVAAALTLFVGIVVLMGAVASGQRARRYDAVVLKTLGLTRPDLMRVYLLEYAALGVVTGLAAAACGAVIAFGLLEFVFKVPSITVGFTSFLVIIGAVVLTILFGLSGTWRILAVRPARMLHAE